MMIEKRVHRKIFGPKRINRRAAENCIMRTAVIFPSLQILLEGG
jgi:hypothetical protein